MRRAAVVLPVIALCGPARAQEPVAVAWEPVVSLSVGLGFPTLIHVSWEMHFVEPVSVGVTGGTFVLGGTVHGFGRLYPTGWGRSQLFVELGSGVLLSTLDGPLSPASSYVDPFVVAEVGLQRVGQRRGIVEGLVGLGVGGPAANQLGVLPVVGVRVGSATPMSGDR